MRCLILACTSIQGEHEVPVYLSEVGRVLHWNDMNECTVKFYSHQLIHFLIQLCTSLLSYINEFIVLFIFFFNF
jgi:hypothetical protein